MPPKAKTPEQLLLDKQHIIDEAVKLIARTGLDNFSVRKLSRQVGMSPANMYNYFYSKDEINIAIRMRGFNLLYETYDLEVSRHTNPRKRLEAYIRQFIFFGIRYSEYYKLMFTAEEPKYLDYIGTPLEESAFMEKQNSLQNLNYLENLLKEIAPGKDDDDCRVTATRIICEIHGIISLTHSNILAEINSSTDEMTDHMILNLLPDLSA